MLQAIQQKISQRRPGPQISHAIAGAPRRAEAEAFIRGIFQTHYGADVPGFAPNLMLLERDQQLVAAAGWRCAGDEQLMLEAYLDAPVENLISHLAGQPVARRSIVEVGNLAAAQTGSSVDVILNLARHLDQLGYEWVVFTATSSLIRIFGRLGLHPLALAPADPARLGEQARAWGTYYETNPVVVAGRIRRALDKVAEHA